MTIFLSALLIMIGLLAMVLTFFQESEGGVLGNTSTNGAFSVKSTNSFIEKLTFFCLAAIIVLSMTINYIHLKEPKNSILDKAEHIEMQKDSATGQPLGDIKTDNKSDKLGDSAVSSGTNESSSTREVTPSPATVAPSQKETPQPSVPVAE